MRKTKIICTIGPNTCNYKKMLELTKAGMDVARLNLSHGDYDFHKGIIDNVNKINKETEYLVSLLLDTKGSEVRSGDLSENLTLVPGEEFTFTTRKCENKDCVFIKYEGFPEQAEKGDIVLVEGGLMSLEVLKTTKTDVICKCIDGGELTSRRHINIRGKSANLPSITKQDWKDIEFGIKNNVDFIALSFVKDGSVVLDLKKYLNKNNASHISIISKIESVDAVKNLDEIIRESDGIMVARGDLGAELPIEEIPVIQKDIVSKCNKFGKNVIVATQLLESMIQNPTPTRAEVSDIATAVKEGADTIMLSGETAAGAYPIKAVKVMDIVARNIENSTKHDCNAMTNLKDEMVNSATNISDNLCAKAIIVITRSGDTARRLSQKRPNSSIFAFTSDINVKKQLNIYWGIQAFQTKLSKKPKETVCSAINILKEKKLIKKGNTIVVVSDILVDKDIVSTVQIRTIR